jgi:transcriptional regulator with XRE-family HTH domain
MKTATNTIGQSLRRLRQSSRITQDELAERSGLSKNYICQVESGRKSPSLNAISKLAACMGADVNDILSDHETIVRVREIINKSSVDSIVAELKHVLEKL